MFFNLCDRKLKLSHLKENYRYNLSLSCLEPIYTLINEAVFDSRNHSKDKAFILFHLYPQAFAVKKKNASLNLCKSKSSSLFTLFLKMLFHYLIEGMCHRNKYTICTVFVCTHAAGRGRDKGLSFLTHCLVTLSGYDRACTCLSSSSRSPTLALFFFFF